MIEDSLLAARLVLAMCAVLLLPGLAFLRWLRVELELPARIVFAFSLSYSWLFVVSILLPAGRRNVDFAAVLTGGLALALLITSQRFVPASLRSGLGASVSRCAAFVKNDRASIAFAAVLIASGIAGWLVEPPITGEEALDLVSAARFADGGTITFDNTSLMPDARAVYLFQPYQLAVGMIARYAIVSPLVALVKLRAFFVLLSFASFYMLCRQLTSSRGQAFAAWAVGLVFIVSNVSTWETNSMFPLVRRGGVSAGLCIPALMTLVIVATRRVQTSADRIRRRLATYLVPVMLLAALSTHPLEVFTWACFTGALILAIFTKLDREGDRRAALRLASICIGAIAGYLFVQSQAVDYVARFERQQRVGVRRQLDALPVTTMIRGPATVDAERLLGRVSTTTVGVIGVPALAAVALAWPSTAAILGLAIVPLALVYASPGGFLALSLVTSPATVADVNAYFALLGLLATSMGIVAIARAALVLARRRSRALMHVVLASVIGAGLLALAWVVEQQAVTSIVELTQAWPALVLGLATALVLGLAIIARRRNRLAVAAQPCGWQILLLATYLALPIALAQRGTVDTLFSRLQSARHSPSVGDWSSYYPTLSKTIAPPLPVPRSVIDELQIHLPVRQILLANPAYSCALVVLVDAYCINPQTIYGHYFLPAQRYHDVYVRPGREPGDWHPFFNMTASLDHFERQLLAEYPVSYILADPQYAGLIDQKLHAAGVDVTMAMNRDGYVLYRITRS